MTRRFTIRETPLGGLFTVCRHPRYDDRGYLERLFCDDDFSSVIPTGKRIVQINRTLTRAAGLVRGMHFQRPPHAELKIISCLRGAVYDVAVDVRPASPTRHAWHGVVLSADSHNALVIPEGFAHGFQAMTADCELLYLHTAAWVADSEAGLNPLDPALDIRWPLPVAGMSDRDHNHPLLRPTVPPPYATPEAAA